MKSLEEIEQTLEKYKPLLKYSFNVSCIGIFGSYARREESQENDIDILVDFCGPIGWKFIDLKVVWDIVNVDLPETKIKILEILENYKES